MQNLESDPVILLRCIFILPNKGCYQYCYCYSIWPNGFSGWRYTPLYSGNLNLIYTLKGVYLTLELHREEADVMDPILLFMLYRMLIVLGGILCIYFGYRLFYVTKTKQGDFKIKTGQNYELSLSDVAPGVFFALFGAGVLVFSLTNGITIKPGDLAGMITTKPSDLSNIVQRQSEISNRPPQPLDNQNIIRPAQRNGDASNHAPCMSQRAGDC